MSSPSPRSYAVHVAAHGGHALRLLDAVAPCVVLLDVAMPVVDGVAFARAYRARPDAAAHLIAMTAAARPDQLAAIAPVAVVRKPFDRDALLPLLARWVQAHPAQPGERAAPPPSTGDGGRARSGPQERGEG